MFCRQCGKEVADGTAQCPSCGAVSGAVQTAKAPQAGKTSGLAIASLVLGIMPGIPVIGSILAIVFATQAKGAMNQDRTIGGRGLATAGMTLGIVQLTIFPLAVFAALLLPALSTTKDMARRTVCISNLKQAGTGMQMFAQDHQGKFPQNLSELLPEYCQEARTFLCPSTSVTVDEIAKDPTLCYGYTKGMTEEFDPACILMCDREGNHRAGRNAVFVDGSAMWVRDYEWPSVWATHRAAFEAGSQRSRQSVSPVY